MKMESRRVIQFIYFAKFAGGESVPSHTDCGRSKTSFKDISVGGFDSMYCIN